MRLALLVLWFVLLPFLSRLPRGLAWMLQYLPDDGRLVAGLLFFSGFNLIPAAVAITAAKLADGRKILLWLPFAVMSVLTFLAHGNYDLASDAQAAIWLVIAPVYIGFIGGVVTVLVYGGLRLMQWRRGR